jgi:amino acid transporter
MRLYEVMLIPIPVASMSEEVRNPAIQVPKAMLWSVPIGGLWGLIFLLPIVFTLPDIATLLSGEFSHWMCGQGQLPKRDSFVWTADWVDV